MPESGSERRPGDRQPPRRRCHPAPRACRPAPAPPRRGSAPRRRRKHRLVLDVGEDAEAVLARHVGRGEDRLEPGVPGSKRIEIAERERRARMRRAHDAQPQRLGRRRVGAEVFGAGDLRPSRRAGEGARRRGFPSPRLRGEADSRSERVRGGWSVAPGPSPARPSAESPLPASGERGRSPSPPRRSSRSRCSGRARRRAHPRPAAAIGERLAREQIGRRHQHAGRADAALGRAVVEEGAAQALGQRRRGRALRRCRPSRHRACAVGTRQAQTCAPSSSTVQAPQSPASQPILVPVRPSRSRSVIGERRERRRLRRARGSPFTREATPLASRRRAAD